MKKINLFKLTLVALTIFNVPITYSDVISTPTSEGYKTTVTSPQGPSQVYQGSSTPGNSGPIIPLDTGGSTGQSSTTVTTTPSVNSSTTITNTHSN